MAKERLCRPRLQRGSGSEAVIFKELPTISADESN
jgi:hypothetical protein